jgi:hypothetical protein
MEQCAGHLGDPERQAYVGRRASYLWDMVADDLFLNELPDQGR